MPEPTATPAPSKPTLNEPVWAVAGIVLAWGLLISQVRHHWGGESYYNFGWFVPPLAIWLLLRNLSGLAPNPQLSAKLTAGLAVLLLLPVLPLHALSEVNPFWRVPLWGQAVFLSGLSLLFLYRFYGWRGVYAGLFPLIFLSTMIPWPFRIEVWLVQSLTGIVIGLAVEGLHFLSYPVEMVGNVLVLGEDRIGVNEACSGIRSLQALFMVTLFLGSLFGQSILRRVLALAVLPLIVIIVNAARAMFLATQTIVNGHEAYESWHDPAGYIAFGVSMVLIYAAIELLNIGSTGERDAPKLDLKQLGRHLGTLPARPAGIAYLVAPLAVFLLVEGWFRYHEWQTPTRPGWVLQLPDESDPDVEYWEISETVEDALGYSYGHRFWKRIGNRAYVEVYYYGYTGENRLASVSSYGHSPAICMEASGAELLEELPPLYIEQAGLRIPVRHFLFQMPDGESKVNVFWIIWENRNMNIDPEDLAELNYDTQLIQLMEGRRDFSRKVVLLNFVGIEDQRKTQQYARDLLTEWIAPAGAG